MDALVTGLWNPHWDWPNYNCVPMHGGGLRPQGKQIMFGTPFFLNQWAFSPCSRVLCTEIPWSLGFETEVARQGLWLRALTLLISYSHSVTPREASASTILFGKPHMLNRVDTCSGLGELTTCQSAAWLASYVPNTIRARLIHMVSY
jgi:hypothetical protein